MSKIAAKNSQVLIEVSNTPTALLSCKDWSLNTNRGTIDVSTISTEWKEFLTGQITADGSITVIYDTSDTTVAAAIETAMFDGTEIKLHLRPEGTGAGKVNYALSALITAWNISAATEDAITVSVSFTGTGAVTKTTQTTSPSDPN